MVILNEGLNKVRDMVYDDIDSGQLGTGITSVTVDDTGLASAVSVTQLNLDTKTKGDRAIKFQYTLPSTGGITTTFKEFELLSSANSVDYDRIIFTGLSFTTQGVEDLIIIKTYFFDRK